MTLGISPFRCLVKFLHSRAVVSAPCSSLSLDGKPIASCLPSQPPTPEMDTKHFSPNLCLHHLPSFFFLACIGGCPGQGLYFHPHFSFSPRAPIVFLRPVLNTISASFPFPSGRVSHFLTCKFPPPPRAVALLSPKCSSLRLVLPVSKVVTHSCGRAGQVKDLYSDLINYKYP